MLSLLDAAAVVLRRDNFDSAPGSSSANKRCGHGRLDDQPHIRRQRLQSLHRADGVSEAMSGNVKADRGAFRHDALTGDAPGSPSPDPAAG